MHRLCLILCLLALPAAAEVRIDQTFTATGACEANRKLTADNPGGVRLVPGRTYAAVALNTARATHVQLDLPGVPAPARRWVAIGCGHLGEAAAGDATEADGPVENLLAVSWQPGFCATGAGRDKRECRSLTTASPAARQFSLHGLWPDDLDDRAAFPCWCGDGPPSSCRGSGRAGPVPRLPEGLRARLEAAMPGTQSGLDRHEWAKHGTCYEAMATGADAGATAEEYFAETLGLLDQLNASPLPALFAKAAGGRLGARELRAAFDAAFGPGAGDRVLMICDEVAGERVVTELWIGLGAGIGPASDLGALIHRAPPARAFSARGPCEAGLVVRAR